MSWQSESVFDENSERSVGSCEYPTYSKKKSIYAPGTIRTSVSTNSIAPSLCLPSLISHSMLSQNAPPAFIVCSHKKKSKKKEEYVNEAFIQRFNERIGDEGNTRKAKRLMEKMTILAGLHPSSTPETIDIPAARFGFALLSGLNHHELKMEALNHLEYLLENDPIRENSSIRLVALAIKVMNQLDRELIQTEILEVQIKGAKIYSLLAELIQRHFAKHHINAITDDLRAQLLKTARSLRALNRLEDPRLTFYVESALEGIKRILDDHNDLYEVVERLYSGAMLAISLYANDLTNAPQYTQNSIMGIDLKIKFSWYDAAMTILKLGRKSVNNASKLMALQKFVFDNAQKLNWKFLFLAVDLLTNIAIKSRDPAIRVSAFAGDKEHKDLPGLLSFSGCSSLGKWLDITPLKHLDRPKLVNHDATVRLHLAKSLIRIAKESPDQLVRMRARIEFLNRYKIEKSEKVLVYMREIYKGIQDNDLDWILENPPFDNYPIDSSDSETTSLTPRRSIDCSTLFQETLGLPQNLSEPSSSSSSSGAASSSAPIVQQEKDPLILINELIRASNYYSAEQSYTNAIELLSTAIKQGRAHSIDLKLLSDLYLSRANAYYSLKNLPSTEHDLLKAVEFNPNNAAALGLLEGIQNG